LASKASRTPRFAHWACARQPAAGEQSRHNAGMTQEAYLPEDAERLRRLQTLTDAALAHLDLDELLGSLLLRAREALEVDTCAILLLDEETAELVARAAVGIEE
jgi:hypothetical protein